VIRTIRWNCGRLGVSHTFQCPWFDCHNAIWWIRMYIIYIYIYIYREHEVPSQSNHPVPSSGWAPNVLLSNLNTLSPISFFRVRHQISQPYKTIDKIRNMCTVSFTFVVRDGRLQGRYSLRYMDMDEIMVTVTLMMMIITKTMQIWGDGTDCNHLIPISWYLLP
jgi:hypothetical protein